MKPIRPASTTRRCPKCRSRSFLITETTEALMSWEVTDGKLDRGEGYTEFGSFIDINGECLKCRHRWKFRGQQIDDIVTEDGHV